ncbi:General transcription factor IIH subunit 3 [Strongyloides ratti]|uniref:General transcription factor IIH subunit 3 n=1 Tax=Strongyloides ratti TaxID=34506 RepID=A0A090LES0_STRRB|nr:General transcription factor IIH subunit 3 [Strongyloides ratti]CEF68261.1 General transcription factor IIH subunit 3 [Strongyloides ratti]
MSCQIVILDCNIGSHGQLFKKLSTNRIYEAMTTAIAAFGSQHLSSAPTNKFVLLAAGKNISNKFIYISDQSENVGASIEILNSIQKTFRNVLHIRDKSKYVEYASPLALALCQIRKFKSNSNKGQNKITIINLSPVTDWERDMILNCAFAAKQYNILIDVIAFALHQTSPVLHQCCDITGGTHVHVEKPYLLLQYLNKYVSPDEDMRVSLKNTFNGEVDYCPTCICHGKSLNIGFVCSVCLSIHCAPDSECYSCKTIFNKSPPTLNDPKSIMDVKKTIQFVKIYSGDKERIETEEANSVKDDNEMDVSQESIFQNGENVKTKTETDTALESLMQF